MGRLFIFCLLALTSLRPRLAFAEDDTPSTLSPRATKERVDDTDPNATTPAPSAGPTVTPPRRTPTKLELVMRKIKPELALRLNRSKEMRTTGQLLVGFGSAALVASTVVWTVLEVAPPKMDASTIDPKFGLRVGGIVTLAVGGLFAVPGAIVWAIGDRRYRQAELEVKQVIDNLDKQVDQPPVEKPPEMVPIEPIPSDRPLYQ